MQEAKGKSKFLEVAIYWCKFGNLFTWNLVYLFSY